MTVTAELLLTTDQLAKRWHMDEKHLSNMRQKGGGPAFFRPSGGRRGRVLYRLADVQAYEEKNLKGGSKCTTTR